MTRSRRNCWIGVLLAGLLGQGAAFAAGDPSARMSQPTPALDPSTVVRIQLEALRSNTPRDEGIALTYRFASPANRRSTGPLPRFTAMLRAAPYDRLLNHRDAVLGPLEVDDDRATLPVVVVDAEGRAVGFVWRLSRQPDGEYRDCWMTDAVMPAEPPVPVHAV